MAVSPKERAALEKMIAKAPEATGADLPEGTLEFLIVDAKPQISTKGKPSFLSTLQVVGGNDSLIGQKVPIQDNLETPENVAWFKKKLRRLKIEAPTPKELVDQLVEGDVGRGSLAHLMKGRKFVGQVRYKDDFMNIYVNRLIGTEEVPAISNGHAKGNGKAQAEAPEAAAEEQEEEQEEKGEEKVEVKDIVKFTSKADGPRKGEVLELIEEGGLELARVKDDENGKTYRIAVSKLEIVYEDEGAGEADESEEETPAKGKGKGKAAKAGKFPKPEEIDEMRLPEIKEALAEHGFDADEIKGPREFAAAVAGFVHEKDYMPEVTALAGLCAGLGVKFDKGAKASATVRALRDAVDEKFG